MDLILRPNKKINFRNTLSPPHDNSVQHICVHLQYYHRHSLSGSVFVFDCDATFNLFQEKMQQECKVFRKKTEQ